VITVALSSPLPAWVGCLAGHQPPPPGLSRQRGPRSASRCHVQAYNDMTVSALAYILFYRSFPQGRLPLRRLSHGKIVQEEAVLPEVISRDGYPSGDLAVDSGQCPGVPLHNAVAAQPTTEQIRLTGRIDLPRGQRRGIDMWDRRMGSPYAVAQGGLGGRGRQV
jgi:hypothetical protein